jgi:hypothetical protein
VNVSGSAIGLEGRIRQRPRDGLVAYSVPARAHVRWLASGLAPDGWTGTRLRYRAWPVEPGRYVMSVYVPAGTPPRKLAIGRRTFVIRPGKPRVLTVPTEGAPLAVRVDVPNAPLGGRVLGVKVRSLRFQGGFGGIRLVAGARWSVRGKDAGSARMNDIRARPRTQPRGDQRDPAAQPVYRRALLGRRG